MQKKNLMPVLIHDFNIYNTTNGSEKMIGISGEVTLPTIAFKTLDISGPGISGDLAVAIYGATEKMEMEIPFRSLMSEMFDMLAPNKITKLTLRGSVQNTDLSTQNTEINGIKIDIGGQAYELNPGKVKKEEGMGSFVKLTLRYFAVSLGGTCVLKIDKLNNILEINGKDILKEIRDLC